MATKQPVEKLVEEKALFDANVVYKDNRTVGLVADNYRRILKSAERDCSLPYFDRGRELYALYVRILTAEVKRIYVNHGMTVRYSVPEWGRGRGKIRICC